MAKINVRNNILAKEREKERFWLFIDVMWLLVLFLKEEFFLNCFPLPNPKGIINENPFLLVT